MKYMNANGILPEDLIRELQEYIQGGYLYVPVKGGQRKVWGEQSGYRKEISKRNEEILVRHRSGATIEELSEAYYLSVHAIRKIIYRK